MRILLHDLTGHPFQIQLSRQLAKRGHQVLHSYAKFFQGPKGALKKRPEDADGLIIEGLELDKTFQKYSFVKRLFQEMSYSRLLLQQVKTFQPEVVVFANTPSEVEWYVQRVCQKQKIKTVHWVQDVYGIAINRLLQKKVPVIGSVVGQVFIWFDRRLAQNSGQVVLISEDFQPLLKKWKVPQEKVHIIPNWAPLEEMPIRSKNNDWAIRQHLNKGFNFIYAGTLGMKHNPDLIIQLSKQFLSTTEDVRVIVISEGLGADWIKKQKKEQHLGNLIILPYQPYACLPDVLGSADVLLAILEPDAGFFSVPSKVLSYLCTQRPLLLAVPLENLAARVVRQNEAGFVVIPNDIEGFINKAVALYENSELCKTFARNGRQYAEKQFDIDKITTRFEEIIMECFNAPS